MDAHLTKDPPTDDFKRTVDGGRCPLLSTDS